MINLHAQKAAALINRDDVKQLMMDLVAAPSPQTDLLEAEPQIRAFIDAAIEPKLRSFGISNIMRDSMGNLIARHGANKSGKRLIMVTHAMNHPAASMPDPYTPKVIDGAPHGLPGEAILGRGLCEQKADMSAMLTAVKAVLATNTPLDGELVYICCTSGETGKHDAIRTALTESALSDGLGLIGGNSLQIRLGNRGRLDIFIKVKGKVSHSGSPHKGANAITGAAMVMEHVLKNAKLPAPHADLGPCTLTFTHIRSFPDATHTVQGECELTLDRRLLPGEDPDAVFAEISRIAREIESKPDPASGLSYSVEVIKGPFMYPSCVAEDSQIVQLIKKSSAAILGYEPTMHYGQSAFDQGYLNHVGIETANYGPGEDAFAHTDLDMASVERTYDGARVMAAMICEHLAATS